MMMLTRKAIVIAMILFGISLLLLLAAVTVKTSTSQTVQRVSVFSDRLAAEHVSAGSFESGRAAASHSNRSNIWREVHSQSPALLTQPSQTTSRKRKPRGYLLVVHVAEQLESGLFDLFQLAYLASVWGMQLVEPFIHRSYYSFTGSPHPPSLSFSSLFNFSAVNEQLGTIYGLGYPLLVSFEHFMAESRTASLVHVMKKAWEAREASACTASLVFSHHKEKVQLKINSHATQPTGAETRNQVHVTELVCVDARKQFNFKQLLMHLPKQVNGSNTIIFDIWNGIKSLPDKFFYHDPDFRPPSFPTVHQLPHSQTVLMAVQEFQHRLGLSHPYLAIHIRLERLIRADIKEPGVVSRCMGTAMDTIKDVSSGVESVIAVRDYGQHGSDTCASVSCKVIAEKLKIDSRLKALGVRVIEYNSPPGAKMEATVAFRATVEQELLARADRLVTLGWGSFQRSVRDRFLSTHSEEQYHALCRD